MFTPSVTHPIGDFVRKLVPDAMGYVTPYLPQSVLEYIPAANSVVAFLINAVICIIAVCIVAIGNAPILIYMERKVCAHVQCRLGPMRLGWHGTIQTIADVLKMLFKEVYAPKGADKFIFYLAPMVVLIAPFLVLTLIPFDKNMVIANVPVGIPFIIAVNGFGILGILLGGWSSNNKYSLLGSLRSGAQMISYEISFAMILLFVVMVSGETNLLSITQGQEGTILDWWIFKIPVLGFIAFVLFFISSTAELNRAPFDIAEAEQELTGGYHTEYNGTAFAMFYLAEYINLVTTSSLATTCFLGGFYPPLIGVEAVDSVLMMVPGFVWFFAKVYFMIWCYMMVRWTFVRPRVDQLMDFEWKFLLPVNLVLLGLGGAYIVLFG
ncbi:MAG: NADH-quinone oxidoreductase subunit H [Fibrobacteraceae bacterium]|nr:NADH-quinone oxidoreductase subunit H [Fibrobacteraceae bacterium]